MHTAGRNAKQKSILFHLKTISLPSSIAEVSDFWEIDHNRQSQSLSKAQMHSCDVIGDVYCVYLAILSLSKSLLFF